MSNCGCTPVNFCEPPSGGFEPIPSWIGATGATGPVGPVAPFLAWGPIVFFGEATQGQIFGYFRPLADVTILGAQLFAQEIPVGSSLTIDIVNSLGVAQGRVATLPDGESVEETIFGTPLPVLFSEYVQFKITGVGSSTPGGYFSYALILE